MALPNSPIVNAGLLYVNGVRLQFQGGGAVVATGALLNMEPGQVRDSTNTNDIVLPQAVSAAGVPVVDQYGHPVGAMINGAFVGANGVDVAAIITGGFYGVYVIGDSTGFQPSAGLLSLNEVTPVLPEGYDMYRRVGYIFTSTVSGAIVINQWYQYGSGSTRNYWYDKPLLPSTVTPSTSYAPQILFGAPYLADQVFVDVSYKPATAGNIAQFLSYGSPAAAAAPGPSSPAQGCVRLSGVVAGEAQVTNMMMPIEIDHLTLTEPFVAVLYQTSSASDVLILTVTGFVDFLV